MELRIEGLWYWRRWFVKGPFNLHYHHYHCYHRQSYTVACSCLQSVMLLFTPSIMDGTVGAALRRVFITSNRNSSSPFSPYIICCVRNNVVVSFWVHICCCVRDYLGSFRVQVHCLYENIFQKVLAYFDYCKWVNLC